jgi:hypothetical protein
LCPNRYGRFFIHARIAAYNPELYHMKRLPQSADVEDKLEHFRVENMFKKAEEQKTLMAAIREHRQTRVKPPPKSVVTEQALRKTYSSQNKRTFNDRFDVAEGEPNLHIQTSSSNQRDTQSAKDAESRANLIEGKLNAATTSATKLLKERKYEEMMDQHALQIFMLRNGRLVSETPEFQSFKRLAKMEKVRPFLELLQDFASKLGIKTLWVNGSKLLLFAAKNYKPTVPLVLQCLQQSSEPSPNDKNFYAQIANLSAVKIQAQVRRIQAEKLARKMRIVLRKVRIIQEWYRAMRCKIEYKESRVERENAAYTEFEMRQHEFKSRWEDIRQSYRVEIHYNNYSGNELRRLTLQKIQGRLGSQIGRVFRTIDEKVEIVYVTCHQIPEEVKRYYYKVMELAGIRLPTKRVHFIHVDQFQPLPDHFSIPARIMYSKYTIRDIRKVSCQLIADHQ